MNDKEDKVIVAISTGDLNGVGLEVTLKALSFLDSSYSFVPIIFGSSRVVSFNQKALGGRIRFTPIKEISQAKRGSINVLDIWKDDVKIEWGKPTDVSGKYAFSSIQKAAEAVQLGKVDVLVTAPVDKNNIEKHHPNFTGHTGYLEEEWKGDALMLLVSDTLRVALQTDHIPLNDVAANLSKESLKQKIRLFADALKQDFQIIKPRIAVLGLNPHAGDNGLLGKEEQEIILPAVKELFDKESILAFGPYSADSFFQPDTLKDFDGVLAIYHDQGLVAFKTLTFSQGVNFTAGLPFVRTSPDHGTAFDIAGKNKADAGSMRAAIFEAIDIFKQRKQFIELKANAIKAQKKPQVQG